MSENNPGRESGKEAQLKTPKNVHVKPKSVSVLHSESLSLLRGGCMLPFISPALEHSCAPTIPGLQPLRAFCFIRNVIRRTLLFTFSET